jgi:HD-like signal output (HDOD) protein
MDIALIIVAAVFAALVLFLLTKKQDPPEQAMKSRPRVKMEALPEQGQVSPSDPKDKNKDMEALRKTIQAGLKTIFSGASTEQADGPLPSTRYEITLDVYHAVKEGFVDIKEFSSVYDLSTLLDDPNVDLSRIAKIISTDPILSNRILRTVNSAYYGSGRKVDSVNHALALLGFVNIKTILFQNVLSKKFNAAASEDSVAKAVWDHSIKTALCAVYLSDAIEGLHKGRLYTLGLLHDIGKFVCSTLAPVGAHDANAFLPYGEKSSILREDALLGTNHAVVSRIALEESGISDQLLDVIEFHHGPSFTLKSIRFTKEPDHRYLAALFLANQIAKLFAKESERDFFAVQPMAQTYYGFVNQTRLSTIFNDVQVLADIVRSGSLIE